MTSEILAARLISKYLKPIKVNKERVRLGKGVEPIHQVRVYARRMRDLFRNFFPVLPEADIQIYNRHLKQLGRDLGPARDLDIHILFLRDYKESVKKKLEQKAIDVLIQDLSHERRRIQPVLAKSVKNFNRSGVIAGIEKMARNLRRRSRIKKERPVEQTARQRVRKRLAKLLHYRPYVRRPRCVEELHQMRIEAKHLRYSLEGFKVYYGEELQPFIADVVKIQRILGEMHDFDVWLSILPDYKKRHQDDVDYQSALSRLEARCVRQRRRAYERFVKIWGAHYRKRVWRRLESFFENV